MEWVRKGRAWTFGDNVCPDTAVGYPWSETLGDLRNVTDPKELKKVFMVRIDHELPKKVRAGDFIVAGINFGTDRAHEAFWGSLKGAGISGIIAESFAEAFFRHAISVALPILECKNITKKIANENELEVNFKTGSIKNLSTGQEIKATPLADILVGIIEAGGTKLWLEKRVKEKFG